MAPAALAAAVMRRVRGGAAARRRRTPAETRAAGHLLVRRDLVRRRLRAGVDVGHQVPPLHPSRDPGPGDRDRLLPRRASSRAATAARGAAAAVVGIPLLALVLVDLAGAPKNAQRFIWLFSYDYVNAPRRTAVAARARFPGAADRVRRSLFAIATLALGWRRIQRAGGGRAVPRGGRVHVLPARRLHARGRRRTGRRRARSRPTTRCGARPTSACWSGRCTGAARTSTRQNEIYEGPKEERTIFLGDRNFENLKAWMETPPRPARVLPGRARAATTRWRPPSRPTRARRSRSSTTAT